MIPLNLDQILEHLRRKNYDAKLQSETNQIYFIHKAGQLEFPIFFRIFEKGDLLQLLAFIPSNFKEGTQTEVARLLHLINKELDIPGFGMDEKEGVIFYRSMLPAFDKKIDPNLLESFLKAIPLIMRHAKHYVEPRLALIGDAAHTIHPLAGQGVNLGLMDAACLAQSLIEASQQGVDLGSLRPLRRYERWRKGDNSLMIMAMRGFKELFGSSSPIVVQLRSIGLNINNQLNSLKNYFMRYALCEKNDLPNLAKNKNE